MKTKIVAHCLVLNEERFIWYSLMSVLPYVDKVMVWDNGSTDNTVKVIETINSSKIDFRHYPGSYTSGRQALLDESLGKYDWLLILDGDEIWPKASMTQLVEFASNNPKAESVVVKTHNLVGDIYHRLPESAGRYNLAGQQGHLALRLMNLNTIKGLHADLPHGQFGYFDDQNRLVQDRNPENIVFLPVHYAHATHLRRSRNDATTTKRSFKYKYSLGVKIQHNEIPEIYFDSRRPDTVPAVTEKAGAGYWLKAALLSPLKFIKQTVLPKKSGY